MVKKLWPALLAVSAVVLIILSMIGLGDLLQDNSLHKGGTGEKTVTLVVSIRSHEETYQYKTNAKFLQGFMDELVQNADFTYNADFGFVSEINGVKAVWAGNDKYWFNISVRGVDAAAGIAEVALSDGDEIRFTLMDDSVPATAEGTAPARNFWTAGTVSIFFAAAVALGALTWFFFQRIKKASQQ